MDETVGFDPWIMKRFGGIVTEFPLHILFLFLILNNCEVPGVGDEGEQGGHLQACPQHKYA
jgi:hypothetical protein